MSQLKTQVQRFTLVNFMLINILFLALIILFLTIIIPLPLVTIFFPFIIILLDEIEDKIVTSMREEEYSNPIQVPVGPITRARAKKFKEALNGLIQATWAQSNLWRPVEGIAHDKCMIQVLEVSK